LSLTYFFLSGFGEDDGYNAVPPSSIACAVAAAVASSALAAVGLTHQSLAPVITPLLSLSLRANSPREIPPNDPDHGVEEVAEEPWGVGKVEDEIPSEDPVRAHPVYEQKRCEYSESLLPLCTTLLLREGKKGELELSVCAACVRDETWDLSILHDTSLSPAPQQLLLYCGSISLTDCTLGDRGAGRGGSGRGGSGGWTGDRGGGGVSEWGQKGDPRPHFLLPMHPVLNLGPSVSCCTFQGPHCCVVSPGRTVLVDLGSACSRAKITEILNEAVDTEEEGMVEQKVEKGSEKYGVKGGDVKKGSEKGKEKGKDTETRPAAERMPMSEKLLVRLTCHNINRFFDLHLIPPRLSSKNFLLCTISPIHLYHQYPIPICINPNLFRLL
jgi:hypothetical protein